VFFQCLILKVKWKVKISRMESILLGERMSQENIFKIHKSYRGLDFLERNNFGHELKEKFLNSGHSFDSINYYDFFYLYVNWCWLNLNDQDHDSVDSEIFARQVPVAAMNGYDLIDKTMSFLWFRTYSQKDLEGLYSKIKQAVISSEALIGKNGDKDYLMRELMVDVQRNNSRGDSMETAGFQARLEKILTIGVPVDTNVIFLESAENIARMLIGFANFLLGVENDKIWYVCDLWAHPEKYENPVVAEAQNEEDGERDIVESRLTRESGEMEGEELYNFIILSLEEEFVRGEDGQFIEVEKVLERLDELARQYDDDSIRDLYYFNESTGKFEWKE